MGFHRAVNAAIWLNQNPPVLGAFSYRYLSPSNRLNAHVSSGFPHHNVSDTAVGSHEEVMAFEILLLEQGS